MKLDLDQKLIAEVEINLLLQAEKVTMYDLIKKYHLQAINAFSESDRINKLYKAEVI